MERLEGRVADYVVTPEGKLVSGISLTENFAMLLPEIKQMQIVQERIDFLTFKIVKGDAFDASSEACSRVEASARAAIASMAGRDRRNRIIAVSQKTEGKS